MVSDPLLRVTQSSACAAKTFVRRFVSVFFARRDSPLTRRRSLKKSADQFYHSDIPRYSFRLLFLKSDRLVELPTRAKFSEVLQALSAIAPPPVMSQRSFRNTGPPTVCDVILLKETAFCSMRFFVPSSRDDAAISAFVFFNSKANRWPNLSVSKFDFSVH
jgi:hypothetical protein